MRSFHQSAILDLKTEVKMVKTHYMGIIYESDRLAA